MQMKLFLLIISVFLFLHNGISYSQTLQVALSPDKSKVDRSTKNGTATIFFDSSIEDLSIICTDENPYESITKITDNLWFTHIDVKKDIETEGVCYRNYLLKSSASAEYYLTTDTIPPNQVLYYTISLPNELEPKYLEARAKSIALKASALIAEGDSYLARMLALEALPPNMPYTTEAEYAIRKVSSQNSGILHGGWGPAVFSPEGKFIASCGKDDTIIIWDATSGSQKNYFAKGHEKAIHSLAYSPDGKYIVSAANDIRAWETNTGQLIWKSEYDGNHVSCVSFSPNGKYIVSSSWDKTARILDAKNGKQIGESLHHDISVNSAAFSPDGNYVATGSNALIIWDINTRKQLVCLSKGEKGAINSVAYSPTGEIIAYACGDHTVMFYNTKTGKILADSIRHPSYVSSVSFSPDGNRIVTSEYGGFVRIWDVTTCTMIGSPLKCAEGLVLSAYFSPNGKQILSSSSDGIMRILDIDNILNNIKTIDIKVPVNAVSFCQDGKYIISASNDCMARVWDAITGKAIGLPLKHDNLVKVASFSPNGKQLLTSTFSFSEITTVWDVLTHKKKFSFPGGVASFSPNGKIVCSKLFSTNKGSYIVLYDVSTGLKIKDIKVHERDVNSLNFSQDGNYIVSASNDIRVWDIRTGQPLGNPIKYSFHKINYAAFSPDGKYIVSASNDNTVRIWDVKTGKQKGNILQHGGPVYSASYSSDGKYIVTASSDNKVRVWNSDTGMMVCEPFEHEYAAYFASFSPSMTKIVSSSWDGKICIWDFPPLQQLIDETRERFKDRPLTPEEKAKYNLE